MPVQFFRHPLRLVRHRPIGMVVQEFTRQATSQSQHRCRIAVEHHGSIDGVGRFSLLVISHSKFGVHPAVYLTLLALFALATLRTPHFVCSRETNVQVLIQNPTHHAHYPSQQQRAEHSVGQVIHQTRRGTIQPSLPMGQQGISVGAEHSEPSSTTCTR